MQKSLIFGLIAAILLVVFALKNAEIVPINLWGIEVKSSMALIILITITIGVILGIIISIPSISKRKRKIEEKDALILKLTNKLRELTEKEES